jgi:hypothetical protein
VGEDQAVVRVRHRVVGLAGTCSDEDDHHFQTPYFSCWGRQREQGQRLELERRPG